MERHLVLCFTMVATVRGGFAQQPGDLDLSFSTDGMVTAHFAPLGNDIGTAAVLQSDGSIVVAGSTQQDLFTAVALERFLENGDADPSFGSNGQVLTSIGSFDDRAAAVALQSGGRIVVAGANYTNGFGYRTLLARYLTDGTLDPGFASGGYRLDDVGAGGNDRFSAMTVMADGRILAVGQAQNGDGDDDILVARYLEDGAPDPTFSGDGFCVIDIAGENDQAAAIALEPGGSILVAGSTGDPDDPDMLLVRLDANGDLDNSLAGTGTVIAALSTSVDMASGVAVQPDGRIVLSGVTSFSPMVFMVVLRYNSDGSLDNSFAGDGSFQSPHPGLNFTRGLAIAPDGRIILGGTWATSFLLAMVNADGTADTGFSEDGVQTLSFGQNAYGNALLLQPDGKALLVGASNQGATFYDFVLLRYHTTVGTGIGDRTFRRMSPQVSPNPFREQATLSYELRHSTRLSMSLSDLSGRVVRTWVNNVWQAAGKHDLVLELPADLEAGSFVLTLDTGEERSSIRFVKQ